MNTYRKLVAETSPARVIGLITWALLSYILLTDSTYFNEASWTNKIDLDAIAPVSGSRSLILSVILLIVGASFLTATRLDPSPRSLIYRRIACLLFVGGQCVLATIKPDTTQLILLVVLGSILPFVTTLSISFALVSIVYIILEGMLTWFWYPIDIIFSSLPYYMFALFATAISNVALKERRAREEIMRLNEQLISAQQLLTDSAIQDERLRISRDLHDSVGHHLTAMSIQLEISNKISANQSKDHILKAQALVKSLLNEVRQVVSDLRTDYELNMSDSLRKLATLSRIPVELNVGSDFRVPNSRFAETIFRLCQEIITNNSRHSKASKLWIDITENNNAWCISAVDNVKVPLLVKEGMGIEGMRERVEGLGGTFSTTTDRGMSYDICIPKEF